VSSGDSLALIVDGIEYTGWTSATVTSTVEQAASTFSVELGVVGPQTTQPIVMRPGAECEVWARINGKGGDRLIRGRVDDLSIGYDARSHGVAVTGRSLTADLIDCSQVTGKASYKGANAGQIAQWVADGYGVGVTVDDGVDVGAPLADFGLEPTETCIDAIQRACALRGLLVTDDADGDLVLTRAGGAGEAETDLRTGSSPLLSASINCSQAGLFTEYRILSQTPSKASGEGQVPQAFGVASDDTLTRRRVLVLDAEGSETAETATTRAKWEAATRAGRATQIAVTVKGWRQADGGPLWRRNQTVVVSDDYMGVDGVFLIVAVTYSYGPGGAVAELSIAPIAGYEVLAPSDRPAATTPAKGRGKPTQGVSIWVEGEV